MSFSSSVKDDLVRLKRKSAPLRLSELAGLTVCCGSLYVGRGTGAVYTTEALPVGKLVSSLATELYALDATIELSKQERRRRPLVIVTVTGADAEKLLLDTGVLVPLDGGVTLGDGVKDDLVSDAERTRAFLRGAYLGSGSCNNPSRGYHLEIVARSEALAAGIVRCISELGLSAKRRRRADRHVVYVKGDDVSGFLAYLGASGAALAFENVRAEKDFRNYVNRTSNCETANIGKTVDAAFVQTQAIERLERRMELSRLPVPLYEAAMLRLNHPEATLQELADRAGIGKSGMNHRLTRIIRMAEELET